MKKKMETGLEREELEPLMVVLRFCSRFAERALWQCLSIFLKEVFLRDNHGAVESIIHYRCVSHVIFLT